MSAPFAGHSGWWTPESEFVFPREDRAPLDELGDYAPRLADLCPWPDRFSRSFLQAPDADVSSWAGETRDFLRRKLRLQERPHTPPARTLARYDEGAWFREEIELYPWHGMRVPGTLLIPSGKPPFPGVVALHCMGSLRAFGREKLFTVPWEPEYLAANRLRVYGGRSVPHELVRRGYAVIAIDAALFGERVPLSGEARERFLEDRFRWTEEESFRFAQQTTLWAENACFKTLLLRGLNWAGLVAGDDLATLDYLASRPEVDTSRLGCFGLSFGAYRTNYLAALDERIRCAVSVCWQSTLRGIINHNVLGGMGFFTLVPGLHEELDLCDITSLACPRAFLAISGWKDHVMRPQGTAEAHRLLRAVWSKARASGQLGSLIFDAPHEFNPAMQQKAFEWFERHLKDAEGREIT